MTFLFTDVEGSTELLHALGAGGYGEALAEHRRIVREACGVHGGVEVDTQGDAFFVAFSTAPGALAAAAEATRELSAGRLRVRMGVHTGTPYVMDEGYVGVDVHRAARIAACGHGGQVLVSAAAAALVESAVLRDLGEHRLKDLSAPERIFQLGSAEFPPLKSLYRTNLPVPATPFFGRSAELVALRGLLMEDSVRLLTLTGPGGTGKTRLGLQAAAEAADRFPDGIFWVPLAALREAEQLLATVGQALGAKVDLAEHIADKKLLLMLDNFEQIVDAADFVADLLSQCPNLCVLVTSRELLRVPGEQAYPVPTLKPKDGSDLFVARARAADPAFVPGEAVPELCARLEQLPLALELAAVRVRVLSPEQMLERLSQRLDLLKAGRGVDPRQQTLRATIEWSHDLLDAEEKRLFASLSVFVGGCTLEAAEAVLDADLDLVHALVDKSLVRILDQRRLWMLETIREYAAEHFDQSEAVEQLRENHAEYFLAFAERVEPELSGPGQAKSALLDNEYPNMRTALTWFSEHRDGERSLRLASALRLFWVDNGYLAEGRRWLEAALEATGDLLTPGRAKALGAAALLSALQGDWPQTKRWASEGRRLSLELGELRYAGWSMLTLGRAMLADGDHQKANALFEEGALAAAKTQDSDTIAMAAFNLGYAALHEGNLDRARSEFERVTQQLPNHHNIFARALAALGSVALHDNRDSDAAILLRRSLHLARELEQRDDTVAWALELLGIALSRTDPDHAARLMGRAEALREELGTHLEGIETDLHERALKALLADRSPTVFNNAWESGRNAPLNEIVDQALLLDGECRP